jgi:hypothetical protein
LLGTHSEAGSADGSAHSHRSCLKTAVRIGFCSFFVLGQRWFTCGSTCPRH